MEEFKMGENFAEWDLRRRNYKVSEDKVNLDNNRIDLLSHDSKQILKHFSAYLADKL
jgi:hypothetical protein